VGVKEALAGPAANRGIPSLGINWRMAGILIFAPPAFHNRASKRRWPVGAAAG
jgi:hypothetical protein